MVHVITVHLFLFLLLIQENTAAITSTVTTSKIGHGRWCTKQPVYTGIRFNLQQKLFLFVGNYSLFKTIAPLLMCTKWAMCNRSRYCPNIFGHNSFLYI